MRDKSAAERTQRIWGRRTNRRKNHVDAIDPISRSWPTDDRRPPPCTGADAAGTRRQAQGRWLFASRRNQINVRRDGGQGNERGQGSSPPRRQQRPDQGAELEALP